MKTYNVVAEVTCVRKGIIHCKCKNKKWKVSMIDKCKDAKRGEYVEGTVFVGYTPASIQKHKIVGIEEVETFVLSGMSALDSYNKQFKH